MTHLKNRFLWTPYKCSRNRIKGVVIAKKERLMFDHRSYKIAKSCSSFFGVLKCLVGRFKRHIDIRVTKLEKISTTIRVQVLCLETWINSTANPEEKRLKPTLEKRQNP